MIRVAWSEGGKCLARLGPNDQFEISDGLTGNNIANLSLKGAVKPIEVLAVAADGQHFVVTRDIGI